MTDPIPLYPSEARIARELWGVTVRDLTEQSRRAAVKRVASRKEK